MDEHRVMKQMGLPTVPEILQLAEDLIVILLRTPQNFRAHKSILPQLGQPEFPGPLVETKSMKTVPGLD